MIERLTAIIEAQTRQFNRNMERVNDMMRRMADHHTVEVDAEIASFKARVRQAENQIDRFVHRHERTRVDLDADSDPLNRSVSRATERIREIPNRVTTTVTAHTSRFQRQMARVRASMRDVDGNNRILVYVDARTERFENSMNRIARLTNSVTTVMDNSFRGLAQSTIPAIVPALASVVGVLGSIGPMVGVATGGVMGLGSAFATAGTGAAAFGALAVTSIKDVFKASSDLKKLQDKLDETTNAKERAKIMKEIKSIQQSLGKEERKALSTLEDFKANWMEISRTVQKPILKTFTSSLTTFKSVLNSLRPMFKSVANGGLELAESMNSAFKDADMKRFIDFMNKNAGKAFVTFGKIAGNVLRTVMNLIVAFGPLGNDMSASLERITASWVKWSANFGSSKKFQSFIEYTKTNGPKLLQIIGNISGGLTKLFSAFAPMSQDMLTALVNLTNQFNEWADSVTKTKEFQAFIDYIRTNGPKVWSTLGEIAKAITNLLVGMAPLGQTILQAVNGFLKFANAAMESHPAIGKFIAAAVSIIGILRAVIPALVAVSAATNGFRDFVTAARYIRTFKDTAAGIRLAGMISSLKSGIVTAAQFTKQMAVTAVQSAVQSARMAASWTAMKISALVSSLKSGIVQMGLWIKNMTVMAAQSIAQATRTATAWTIMKISSFVTSLRAGIVQMGLWIKQMVVMAAQSAVQAARMAAAWTAAQISSFASMLVAGMTQMIAFGKRLVILAAQAAANAARMAASWVIAMGPIGWITAAVVGLVVLIIANWNKIKAYTIKIWGNLSKWLSSTWTSVKNAASKIWQLFLSLLKKNFELQKNVVLTVYNAIKSFSSKIWNSTKDAVVKIWNYLKNAASTAFLYMRNKVTGHILATKEKLVNLWNSAKSKVISIYNGIKSAASNAFLNMKNQIANRIIATKEKIVSIWNSVMSFFKGINLGSIGSNIMQGLIDGVTGMWKAVTRTFSRLTDAIPSTIKKVLGIHSPSRVMRDQVGYHIGTGIAVGIDHSQSKVKSAATDIAKLAQKAATVEVNNKVNRTVTGFEMQKTAADSYRKQFKNITRQTTAQSYDIGKAFSTQLASGIQNGIHAVQKAISVIRDALYIEQREMSLAYDSSISSGDLGTVRNELSTDIKNVELPERVIVIEMDSKKVGQGVEKPVTDAQKRTNARRVRFN
ncbi:tail tape measure protein [Bacillus sp. CLL-7-23]|uniref:Tail tape measure protein n=1 Tax=Bacillus changyiensis TaxID=3004103 RepID=A0ABT4X870_9BACI|nr:tail tape measure protein [Bacillus changyiensis]MDA7028453.1 tail tape measure protein [Bacillus changyiensis]